MALLPREENITGASCSGTDGATDRTYTMTYQNVFSIGIQVMADRTPLQQGATKDFTYASGIITFLVPIADTAAIYLYYYTSDSTESLTSDLGSPTAVRRILGKESTDLTDAEVTPYLNEACRKLKTKYGPYYMVDKIWAVTTPQTGSVKRDYTTYFDMKHASVATKVYRNGALLTQTTDYTITPTDSLITIADGVTLNDGDVIELYYIPSMYDDYANYIAAKRIMDTSLVDIPGSAQGTSIYQNLKENLAEYDDMIIRKPHVGIFMDHKETEAVW
jgi:hypothetical protein